MIRKEITYTDFNGESHTDPFYFHLTKADILELEVEFKDGLETMLRQVIEAEDNKTILKIFKMIINKAHGVKSEDGKRFIKDDDDQFTSSAAYDELLFEMLNDAGSAAEFIVGCLPADLQKEALKTVDDSGSDEEKPDSAPSNT